MELRKQVNALLPENEKLSVNDFIVKAAALALRQFPNLNASLAGRRDRAPRRRSTSAWRWRWKAAC